MDFFYSSEKSDLASSSKLQSSRTITIGLGAAELGVKHYRASLTLTIDMPPAPEVTLIHGYKQVLELSLYILLGSDNHVHKTPIIKIAYAEGENFHR